MTSDEEVSTRPVAEPTSLSGAAEHGRAAISVSLDQEPRAVDEDAVLSDAKAEKRSAKAAARQLAALEKREARERKALAKAAARRRAR